ncbi:MAG: ABC transporter substrate-binding protein [Chloroflexota bacterium]
MAPRRRLALVLLCLLALAAVALVTAGRWVYDSARVEPERGGAYVEAVAGRPQYINPLLSQFNDVDRDLVALIFAGLTKIGDDGRAAPDLAESWDISADGKTYTFRLRADRQFHNGEPVTVEDVLFTVRLLQDPAFPGLPDTAAPWRGVVAQKASERSVSFTLPEPYGPFLELASLGILPAKAFTGMPASQLLEHPFNGSPVGAGPFKVKDASVQQVVLEPDPNHPGARGYLDQLTLRFYASARAAVTAVQQGEASGARAVPAEELARLQEDKRVAVTSVPMEGRAAVLFFNVTKAPLNDAAVRRAVSLAVDRQSLLSEALGGQGRPAFGPIAPLSWAHKEAGQSAPDLEQARALLEKAGWVDANADGLRERAGATLTIQLLSSEAQERQRVARALVTQLARVGVKVEVVTQPWEQLRDKHLATRDYTAALAEVWLPNRDPDVYAFWHSSQAAGGLNLSGWRSTRADELLSQGRRAWREGSREDSYAEFQKLFAAEAPAVFLYYPQYNYVFNSEVKGASLSALLDPSERFRTFATWYSRTKKIFF